MHLSTKHISLEDNLQKIVDDINASEWDKDNDIEKGDYALEPLIAHLKTNDSVFIISYVDEQFAGMASAYFQLKPYEYKKWLYIDEVDVAIPHRRKGVGTALMQKLFKIARENKCDEVWLGAEKEGIAANKLYTSLNPDDIEEFVGYTFKP